MLECSPGAEDRASEVDPCLLGEQLRRGRLGRQLSVRELARRAGVSASLVSQIEHGRVRPSVSSLLALVGELDLSLDRIFSPGAADDAVAGIDPRRDAVAGRRVKTIGGSSEISASGAAGEAPDSASLRPAAWSPMLGFSRLAAALPSFADQIGPGSVEYPGTRAILELDSGVVWERLTAKSVPGMEFLYVRYGGGASSTPAGRHTRHEGIELGYIARGALHVTLGFDEFECPAGSSLTFDAAVPHRLENRGDIVAEAVWLILGRRSVLERDS